MVLAKAATTERCVKRVREEYGNDHRNLFANITRQDAILLNLQRACEAAIDAAMHLVAKHRLGLPRDSREAFELLAEAGWINRDLAQRLKAMVGFGNLVVHEYQALDLVRVRELIKKRLGDFLDFTETLLRRDDVVG